MNATAAFASSECMFAASHGPAAGMTADRGLRTHMKANAGRGRGGREKQRHRHKDEHTRARSRVYTHTHTTHPNTVIFTRKHTS